MPQAATIRIEGYREFLRASDRAGKDSKKYTRDAFRRVGDVVKLQSAARMAPVSVKSAAGYRTRVRQTGVVVEQSLRKTTGRNPAYGRFQMSQILIPVLIENEPELMRELDHALDEVERHFAGLA